jgi:serine/threonine protein kinase
MNPNMTKDILEFRSNQKTRNASNLETIKVQKVINYSSNNLNSESKDLLRRLLEKNPQYRLKSLLALKKIAMFKNYNFQDIEEKKVNK